MPLDLQSFSGQYTPVVDNAAGVTQVGYEDVASCIVTALEQPQDYNRKMMGIGRK
jgi:putative NADH-flavin reductase